MSISAPGGGSTPTDPSRVRYLAFLLDEISRGMLLAHVHALGVTDEDGWTTHADHVTFFHTPSAEQLASFPWGVECEMEVVGFACDQSCRAVQVDIPPWVPVHPQVAVPHVTVSCAPGTRALESDAMLMQKMALGEIMFTSEFLPLKLTGRFGGVTMSDTRVYAQPGVMDAATRTAVAAVVQAEAAAADAAAAAAQAEARRVESEKAEARTLSMQIAEEMLGEVKLSSRFAGLDELEEEQVTEEADTPESNNTASGSPARRRLAKTTCEICGKRHRGRCRYEGGDAKKRAESGLDEGDKGKASSRAPAIDPGVSEDASALERQHELEGGLSASLDAGANDEDDVDFTEAELLLRELGFADSGAPGANASARPLVPSEGSQSRENRDTTVEALERRSAAAASRAKLASLFPDVPEQVIDDALRACDGNENAAASRFVSGHVPQSVPAYGCLDVDASSTRSCLTTRGAFTGHVGRRRRTADWYPRADAWARREGPNVSSESLPARERLARDASGEESPFEWERAGRARERERDADVAGDPTADAEARAGVVRFYGRGADVPGAFAGSGARAAADERAAAALLLDLDMVRLKQQKLTKTQAMRQSDEHRADADMLFAARAKFLGLAQAARARGDGRAAKDLSSRAAASAQKAHGLKAKAQLLASAHYNDGARGGLEETDLHGADVGAATAKVTRLLSAVSELKMSALKVIYGKGRNSEMGRARLGPAVREFLAGQNIRFIEAQDGGSLIVPLS